MLKEMTSLEISEWMDFYDLLDDEHKREGLRAKAESGVTNKPIKGHSSRSIPQTPRHIGQARNPS